MAEDAPSRSLVAYEDEEEEEEEEDGGARSSDDELLVPRKRVRVQKTEEGGVTLNNAQYLTEVLSLS